MISSWQAKIQNRTFDHFTFSYQKQESQVWEINTKISGTNEISKFKLYDVWWSLIIMVHTFLCEIWSRQYSQTHKLATTLVAFEEIIYVNACTNITCSIQQYYSQLYMMKNPSPIKLNETCNNLIDLQMANQFHYLPISDKVGILCNHLITFSVLSISSHKQNQSGS